MGVRDGPDSSDVRLAVSGVFEATDLADIRARTAAHATRMGLGAPATDRLVLAVSEAVTNVIQYAAGDGELTMFVEDAVVVAEITDRGPGLPTPEADVEPQRPAVGQVRGRGLWLMRRYVDRLTIATHAAGTRIRLYVMLPWTTMGIAR